MSFYRWASERSFIAFIMFYNLYRWLLEAVGSSKTGLPYVLNGLIMTLVFYGSRIIIMPYFWYCVWLLLLPENIKRVGHLVYVLIIASAVLDVINILWAYKMYRGVRKVLSNLFSNKNTWHGFLHHKQDDFICTTWINISHVIEMLHGDWSVYCMNVQRYQNAAKSTKFSCDKNW